VTAFASRRVRRPVTPFNNPVSLIGCFFPLLLLFMILSACDGEPESHAGPPPLRFTAIPDQNSTELKEKFQPLAAYLSEQLGTVVTYVPARDYQASVEMFRNGDVHLAWFGGLTGVQAREAVAGAMAIAQGATDPHYFTYFIAHIDAGIEPGSKFPQDIASLRFTFGSPSSTSGRLMPEYFIRHHTGKTPLDYFEHPVGFSGSHDKTAELVGSGQYQVGAINYKVYERRVLEGSTDPDRVQVVWKTPPYADYNWTVHPHVETLFGLGFIQRLQSALVDIDDPKLLAALPRKRLIVAKNQDFDGIRDVAKILNMIR